MHSTGHLKGLRYYAEGMPADPLYIPDLSWRATALPLGDSWSRCADVPSAASLPPVCASQNVVASGAESLAVTSAHGSWLSRQLGIAEDANPWHGIS